jgi:hypothetical protein
MRTRQLPRVARDAIERDRAGLPASDPGTPLVLPALMDWLAAAQDHSISADGGVARDYSLLRGWSTSYPETTGYIVPTFFDHARLTGDPAWSERALRMADWLVRIQLHSGGFQGGKIDSTPVVPVTFNTGQILIGLAAAQRETGRYLEPMRRAADWLVQTQDADGCWRRHASPFVAPGDKQYDTHVAWGLFEAHRVDPGRGYLEAGWRNVLWAVGGMTGNGWYPKCRLSSSGEPLTHTLGYTLRGVIEALRIAPESPEFATLNKAARLTADGLASALRADGFLPGMIDCHWRSAAPWACLTGSAQVAACWQLLDRLAGERRYEAAVCKVNAYLRRSVLVDGPVHTRGAVRGSFPIDGGYGALEFPNWAAKFLADSLMLEASTEVRT